MLMQDYMVSSNVMWELGFWEPIKCALSQPDSTLHSGANKLLYQINMLLLTPSCHLENPSKAQYSKCYIWLSCIQAMKCIYFYIWCLSNPSRLEKNNRHNFLIHFPICKTVLWKLCVEMVFLNRDRHYSTVECDRAKRTGLSQAEQRRCKPEVFQPARGPQSQDTIHWDGEFR